MRPGLFPRDCPTDDELLTLWREGNDTYDIARHFWQDEASIANRLPRVLDRARQDQEWNFDRLVSA